VLTVIAYTVACAFTDESVCDRWCAWMVDTHYGDLLDAGAVRAELVRFGPLHAESRYLFATREAFDAYERDHAPRLRADGLAHFPLSLGLTYTRSVGDQIASLPR
jgi:hypothetical protein